MGTTDFNNECDAFFKELGESKKMVLATCSGNPTGHRPTARMMSFIILNRKFYFQTDMSLLKYRQISENPFAAICADNIQIEGKCLIKGSPINEENIAFAKSYEKYYSSSFHNYSHMKNEVLIEVTPSLITQWCYDDGKPFRRYLNFTEKTCYVEYYDNEL